MAAGLEIKDSVLKIHYLCKSYVKGKFVNDYISFFRVWGDIWTAGT